MKSIKTLLLATLVAAIPTAAMAGPCVNPANDSTFIQCVLDHGFTYCEDTLNCSRNNYWIYPGNLVDTVKQACCDNNPNVATAKEKACFTSKIQTLRNDKALPLKFRRDASNLLNAYKKSAEQFCTDA